MKRLCPSQSPFCLLLPGNRSGPSGGLLCTESTPPPALSRGACDFFSVPLRHFRPMNGQGASQAGSGWWNRAANSLISDGSRNWKRWVPCPRLRGHVPTSAWRRGRRHGTQRPKLLVGARRSPGCLVHIDRAPEGKNATIVLASSEECASVFPERAMSTAVTNVKYTPDDLLAMTDEDVLPVFQIRIGDLFLLPH